MKELDLTANSANLFKYFSCNKRNSKRYSRYLNTQEIKRSLSFSKKYKFTRREIFFPKFPNDYVTQNVREADVMSHDFRALVLVT